MLSLPSSINVYLNRGSNSVGCCRPPAGFFSCYGVYVCVCKGNTRSVNQHTRDANVLHYGASRTRPLLDTLNMTIVIVLQIGLRDEVSPPSHDRDDSHLLSAW